MGKVKNQMYPWVAQFKLNPIHGPCPHECKYCYVARAKNNPFFKGLNEKYTGELRLGECTKNKRKYTIIYTKIPKTHKPIFVCDCTDLFANEIPQELIVRALTWLRKYPDNTYLLQTKNPALSHIFRPSSWLNPHPGFWDQSNLPG